MGGLLLWAPWTRPLLGLSESVCRVRQSCPTKGTGSWAISPPLPLFLSVAAAPRGVNRCLMQQLSALRQLKAVAALGSLFHPKTEMLLLPERDFRQERQELKVESHGPRRLQVTSEVDSEDVGGIQTASATTCSPAFHHVLQGSEPMLGTQETNTW